MNFYLGIKFHEDLKNKTLIEKICNLAENENHKIKCIHRDLENWGSIQFELNELMIKTFEIIDNSDAVIIEFSESGVGIGIEAGYAIAKGIPVYILIPKGKILSPTMQGICEKCYTYENDLDITEMFKDIS
ncbi:MAG: hypothetical protein ACRCXA_05065 [Peptostreptococcaceae bacterium]